MLRRITQLIRKVLNPKTVLEPTAGYALWAQQYDAEENNLMHRIDEAALTELLPVISLKGKVVVDFGCGTGRLWPLYLSKEPAGLVGIDPTQNMLDELKKKFEGARTFLVSPGAPLPIDNQTIDVLISTLAIEHVTDLVSLFGQWSEILKSNADILITGYHPVGLENGGDISFKTKGRQYSIRQYAHPLQEIQKLGKSHGFGTANLKEVYFDDVLKPYYEKENAMALFERYKGTPLYFAIHLKRGDETH